MQWKKDRITYISRLITGHILEMSMGERLLVISEREHAHRSKNLRSIAYSRLILSRIRKNFKNTTLLEYTALHANDGFAINEPTAAVWSAAFGSDFTANLPSNTYDLIEEGHLSHHAQSMLYRAASTHDRVYDVIIHIGDTNLEASLFCALFAGVQAGRLVSIINIGAFSTTRLYHLELLERKALYLTSNIINAAKTIITSPKGTNLSMTFYKSTPYLSKEATARTPGNSTHLLGAYLTLTPCNINISGTMEAMLDNHEDVLLTLTITNNMLEEIKLRKNKKISKYPTFKIFDHDPFLHDASKMKYLKKPVFNTLTIQETEHPSDLTTTGGSKPRLHKTNKYDGININSDLSLCVIFKQELRSYIFRSRSISVEVSKSNKSPINIILNTVE